jgi:hypothetical protein
VALTGIKEDPVVFRPPPPSLCCTEGLIVTDVALVVAQAIVVVWPALTVEGVALNCVICGATCTVTLSGALVPPGPVATAVYVVAVVGASVVVPVASVLVISVRDEDPAVAVMVIDVALVVVQLSVVD